MTDKVDTFKKIELLLKLPNANNTGIQSTIKTEFINAKMNITGNYLIIILEDNDEDGNVIYSKGQIYNLSDIIAYKTYEK